MAESQTHFQPQGGLHKLKQDLQEVANALGKIYIKQSALLLYWEDDETNAQADVNTMKDFLITPLGIEYIILMLKKNCRTPGWDVLDAMRKILADRHKPAMQPSLLVLYYAGHGKLQPTGSLR
ncbi:uncharacterized protein N7483_000767 [Penicillium malachiteum]|uniref:uncharacterized protein n=1 Tax=Penicillium malachiteum TaxID=1324776 RepID=UPI00254940D1|nr:uncharacterized protein N7483_000767 [Penicillium malachiteum]KAJ5735642.1 hypothetical protein N7483_000767 [Penicillium malachiteum]